MSTKQGGKAKPLKKPKSDKKDYDEVDMANIQKKKEEEKALKELKAKAQQKGSFGGSGLKKSGKKWGLSAMILNISILPSLSSVITIIMSTSLIVTYFCC